MNLGDREGPTGGGVTQQKAQKRNLRLRGDGETCVERRKERKKNNSPGQNHNKAGNSKVQKRSWRPEVGLRYRDEDQ